MSLSPSNEPAWLDPPSTLALRPGVIHLWRATDDVADSTLVTLKQTLNPEEIRRAEQYRFDPDRRRFILCRGILRDLLGRYLDCPPQSIWFSRGRHGKPAIDTEHHRNSSIEFNLSHTKGMSLFGFAPGHAIGVDVEAVDARQDWAALAQRFLHPNEWKMISTLPDEKRASAFYTCWTCKEAYVKARGDGLMRALASFEVILPASSTGRAVLNDPTEPSAARWLLHELHLAPGFASAVASAIGPDQMDCFRYG